jgi:hypothetical protein
MHLAYDMLTFPIVSILVNDTVFIHEEFRLLGYYVESEEEWEIFLQYAV